MEERPMLVLSRKPGERICIGSHITVQVLDVQGSQVRIGISAPRDITILRSELQQEAGSGSAAERSAGRDLALA
jgi:carbon storage regulator